MHECLLRQIIVARIKELDTYHLARNSYVPAIKAELQRMLKKEQEMEIVGRYSEPS